MHDGLKRIAVPLFIVDVIKYMIPLPKNRTDGVFHVGKDFDCHFAHIHLNTMHKYHAI
jgi:hypothetical protein